MLRAFLPALSLLPIFLCSVHAITQDPAPTFPPLAPPTTGVLHHIIPHSSGALFSVSQTPTSTLIQKRSATLQPLWTTVLSASLTPPTLAFSPPDALFALAVHPTNLSQPIVDVILYELHAPSGSLVASARVERVRLLPGSTASCVLASARAATGLPRVYVTYIVQDGVRLATARTRVVKMERVREGYVRVVWTRVLTSVGRVAASVALAGDAGDGGAVVVEVSRGGEGVERGDVMAVYYVDGEGEVARKGEAETEVGAGGVRGVAVDEVGGVYVGVGNGGLHRVAVRKVAGQEMLAKIWSVGGVDVVDVGVVRNGSAVYVLANKDGFRNEAGEAVRIKKPVLAMYNSSGHALFRTEYVEKDPDAEREMFCMALVGEKTSADAMVGGYVRMTRGVLRGEKEVAIGVMSFPESNLAKVTDPDVVVIFPTDEQGEAEGRSRTILIAVGAGLGGALLVSVILGGVLFVVYGTHGLRKEFSTDDEGEGVQGSACQPPRDNTVLV